MSGLDAYAIGVLLGLLVICIVGFRRWCRREDERIRRRKATQGAIMDDSRARKGGA